MGLLKVYRSEVHPRNPDRELQMWEYALERAVLPQLTTEELENFLVELVAGRWQVPGQIQEKLPWYSHLILLQDCLRARHMVELVEDRIMAMLQKRYIEEGDC